MLKRKIYYVIAGAGLGLMPGIGALTYDFVLRLFGSKAYFLENPTLIFLLIIIPLAVFSVAGLYIAELEKRYRKIAIVIAVIWFVAWIIAIAEVYGLIPHFFYWG